ncbi:Gfo/Idh/MocA family protein [Paenibacillus crassostreae]|uniref:Oxidoreductase n=1 Tax=Paenibacillus crassostreae TaxID=1763538 RepID=A0A167FUG1_9BACL|nr:Gfo/Idh/MocA family oxidoreductase [Paenibacillus crassostreae]AOZ94054.1 oxidoreductase [Paenibacillus crassostreae]OAB76911.1 oxidoreductase [Paenibacillus crassostreae]
MSKFKVGIIGCGNIFPMHASSIQLSDTAELVAICDNKEERAKQAAEKYNCNFYTNYEEMLDKEEIDVVHICTPHYLHASMTKYVASKGKHILTEKPMSITTEEAREMVDVCESNGVTLGVIFQNRYNPGSQLIKDAIMNGSLGQVLGAKCSVTWNRSDEYYSQSDWKGTWEKEGGGVLIDQAIHTMDLMRWFVGEEIEYVDAQIGNRAHEIIEVEDSVEGVIKFKNGIFGGFFAINYYSYDAPVEIEVHCVKGIAKMVADKATIKYSDGKEVTVDKNPNEVIDYGEGVKIYWGVSHMKQIRDYYEALKNGETPFIDGKEALKTQEMISGIYQSGKEHQRIYL